jgi:hypothetical protein
MRVWIAFSICVAICACSNAPIEDYVVQNGEEAEIKALLIQYRDARKNFDLERYLGCLHDRGTYHHASRLMLSKKELSDSLPDFWDQLRRGDRSFFPMCRENLSGNYFVGFHLINPRIVINRNTAHVTVTYTNTGWRLKHYISLIKENDRWLINRLDWETG